MQESKCPFSKVFSVALTTVLPQLKKAFPLARPLANDLSSGHWTVRGSSYVRRFNPLYTCGT